jgi:very-short-patch-repair endonuclease
MVNPFVFFIIVFASLCVMGIVYDKIKSAMLLPKGIKRRLARRPISRKAHLKTCSNSTKSYRTVPRWKLERWAREKRATQVDEHGMPIWPAEVEFLAILRRLTNDIRIQEPFYTPQTFILRDLYVPSARVVFEVDGSTHGAQMGYDAECDQWLASMGIRTVRISNATVQRSPHIAEQVARQALGLTIPPCKTSRNRETYCLKNSAV